VSCSLTLKSSRLVDLWVIPYCLPYCYAAGIVYHRSSAWCETLVPLQIA
jgi:hypothetical protein